MAEFRITLPVCLNAQFLLCGLRVDSNFRQNMLVQDHLGQLPLSYMTYMSYSKMEASGIPLLKLLSARKTLDLMFRCVSPDVEMNTHLKVCISPRFSDRAVETLAKYLKANMTFTELSEVTDEARKIVFMAGDIVSMFKCSIITLPDKQHTVFCLVHLLHIIGTEMGKIDPLFECLPELKGSVQEYTKCGELDELDTSMKLVKFGEYFRTCISKDGIKITAAIAPLCSRYRISGEVDTFSSVEFCADFWRILLKALDTEAARTYMKSNKVILENCKRKHGFVGLLNLSCLLGEKIQLISVDITPSIVSDSLDGYTALLRPRHYDHKEVGDDFYNALELSSSQKDWDFLGFVQPEVMCGYALVKMLRSLADTFQTTQGKVYTAEDILPSYMVKTALLWILDPEEKCSRIYNDLDIITVFHSESSNSYKNDVLEMCQELLQNTQTSGLDCVQWAKDFGKTAFQCLPNCFKYVSNIFFPLEKDEETLMEIYEKMCHMS